MDWTTVVIMTAILLALTAGLIIGIEIGENSDA
jgi:hypothetical protein